MNENENVNVNEISESIAALNFGEVYYSELDDTTYVIRTEDGFAVCDNGEEVSARTAAYAARIVVENAS